MFFKKNKWTIIKGRRFKTYNMPSCSKKEKKK